MTETLGSWGVGLKLESQQFLTDWRTAENAQVASVERMRRSAEAANDAFAFDSSAVTKVGEEAAKSARGFESMVKSATEGAAKIGAEVSKTYDKIEQESKFAATAISVAVGAILAGTLVGAIYTLYKVTKEVAGFIAGLFTGSSYQNEYVQGLVDATKANDELARSLGVTTAQASAVNEAFAAAGKDVGNYSALIASVTTAIRSGNSEYERLGIATKTQSGQWRESKDVLLDVSRVLDQYTEGFDRNAAASALGVGSAAKVAEAVAVQKKGFADAAQTLESYSLLLGPLQTQRAKEFEDATRAFTHNADLTAQGFKRAIADGMMPILADLADFFKDGWPAAVQAFRVGMATITTIIQGFVMGVYIIAEPILALVETTITSIVTIGKAAWAALSGGDATKILDQGRAQIKQRWSDAFDGISARSQRTWDNITLAWGQDDKGPAGAAKRTGKEWKAAAKEVESFTDDALAKLLNRLENTSTGVNQKFYDELKLLHAEYERGGFTIERYQKLVTELVNQTAYGKAQIERAKEAAKAWGEELKADADAIKQLADAKDNASKSLEDFVEQMRFENTLIGLTNEQRTRAIELRKLETAGIDAQSEGYKKLVQDLDTALADGKRLREQQDWWKTVYDYSNSTIENIVRDWRGGLRQVGEDIQNYIIKLLARLVTQQWIIPIVASVTGGDVGAIASALGVSGGNSALGQLGSLSSLFSSGSTLGNAYNTVAGWFGSGSANTGANVWAGAGYGEAAGSAAGASSASSLSTLSSAAGTAATWVAAAYGIYQAWRYWGNDNVGRAGVAGGAAAGAAVGTAVFPVVGTAIGAVIGAVLGGLGFGRRRTNADANGIQGTFGNGTFNGQFWQDLSQRGGLFRSDRRWTEYQAMTAEQSSPFTQAAKQFQSMFDTIGKQLGVDAGALLAGFTREFKITLKDRKPEDVKKEIDEFLRSVFRDQAVTVFGAYSEKFANYIRNFTGTTQELMEFVTILGALPQIVKDLQAGKSPLTAVFEQFRTGIDPQASRALVEAQTKIDDLALAFDQAMAADDVVEGLKIATQLQAMQTQRFAAELAFIENIRGALNTLQDESYQFSVGIAERMNRLGRSVDVGAISMARMAQIQQNITGRPIAAQQQMIQQFVAATDAAYNQRLAQIQAEAQAQANAANAQQQAQKLILDWRIAGLQQELDLIQQWKSLGESLAQTIKDITLSGANPLSSPGRYSLAATDTQSLLEQFRAGTGRGKYDAASQIQAAARAQLQLLGENLQRPSDEYLAEYNTIMATLSEVQSFAQTEGERAIALQEQIAALTEQANVIGSQTYDATMFAAGATDALNKEFQAYYEWAQELFEKNNAEQQRLLQAQLEQITGGKDVNLFIAERMSEANKWLAAIYDRLAAAAGEGVNKPAAGDVIIEQIVVNPSGGNITGEDLLNAARQARPQLRRALGVE